MPPMLAGCVTATGRGCCSFPLHGDEPILYTWDVLFSSRENFMQRVIGSRSEKPEPGCSPQAGFGVQHISNIKMVGEKEIAKHRKAELKRSSEEHGSRASSLTLNHPYSEEVVSKSRPGSCFLPVTFTNTPPPESSASSPASHPEAVTNCTALIPRRQSCGFLA